MYLKLKKILIVGLITHLYLFALKSNDLAYAKPTPLNAQSHPKIQSTQNLSANAQLTLSQTINYHSPAVQFQYGKISNDIQFYDQARCYLHMKNQEQSVTLFQNEILKISQIDNIYRNGSNHVTFWFNSESKASNLYCITNQKHTLTIAELQTTLGQYFQVHFENNIEKTALQNIVPSLQSKKILKEEHNEKNALSSIRTLLKSS